MTTHSDARTNAHSWSVLSNGPVVFIPGNSDVPIVYWSGLVMSHNMAIVIAGSLCGVRPSPQMVEVASKKTMDQYQAGWYGDVKFSDSVPNIVKYCTNKIRRMGEELGTTEYHLPSLVALLDYRAAVKE